jgi:hypothetical protein
VSTAVYASAAGHMMIDSYTDYQGRVLELAQAQYRKDIDTVVA